MSYVYLKVRSAGRHANRDPDIPPKPFPTGARASSPTRKAYPAEVAAGNMRASAPLSNERPFGIVDRDITRVVA